MDTAWELIKSKAVVPGERFIIYGVVTHNRFYLRAEEVVKVKPTAQVSNVAASYETGINAQAKEMGKAPVRRP
jgi:hypothetical protein